MVQMVLHQLYLIILLKFLEQMVGLEEYHQILLLVQAWVVLVAKVLHFLQILVEAMGDLVAGWAPPLMVVEEEVPEDTQEMVVPVLATQAQQLVNVALVGLLEAQRRPAPAVPILEEAALVYLVKVKVELV
jgi:Na+-transporting methylmalonyl-CoA/oxaloacetate decarboxylase gamma subunit